MGDIADWHIEQMVDANIEDYYIDNFYKNVRRKSRNNFNNRGNKKMVIQGKALWASVQAPNEKFPPPVYCIDLVIDQELADTLTADGVSVKTNKENGELTVKAKRAQFRKDGTLNTKPNCVDMAKQPFTDLIGNGSLVNLQVNVFDWEFAGKKGRSLDFVGVQVVEHVAFSGSSDEFESTEDGVDSGDFDEEEF